MPSHTAADMMTGSPVTLSPDLEMRSAIRVLLRQRITGAPVVDDTGRLVGVLSEKDCLRLFVEDPSSAPSPTVAGYMSRPEATIAPSASLHDIVAMFLRVPFRRLPVLDAEGRLLGQVARADAMRAIESMSDNAYLYGTPGVEPIPTSFSDGMGVDSSMRIARQSTGRRSRAPVLQTKGPAR